MSATNISYIDNSHKASFMNFVTKRMGYRPVTNCDTYEDQFEACLDLMQIKYRAKSIPQLIHHIRQANVQLSFFRDDLWGIVRLLLFIRGYDIGLHFEFDKDVFKAISDFRRRNDIYVRPLNSDIALSSVELIELINIKRTCH